MRVTGTWLGEYTYGDAYAVGGVAGRSVPFTLSLCESWLRRIAGYVRDDASRGGQPERGRIHGRRRRCEVWFVKSMPVHHVLDEQGELVELDRFLRDRHDIELPADMPPHRIGYRGTLDEAGERLAGTWIILPWAQAADGTPVGGGGTGTWTARRTSSDVSEV